MFFRTCALSLVPLWMLYSEIRDVKVEVNLKIDPIVQLKSLLTVSQ